jgi:hypothetical protein
MKHGAAEWSAIKQSCNKTCTSSQEAKFPNNPESQSHLIGKTSLAWFKLADVAARGEKERTLSIYRLLVHSINHDALSAQLEGDILHGFQDVSAVQSYLKAAILYQKNNDILLAALLYEVIIQIAANIIDYRLAIFSLYQKIEYYDHAVRSGKNLIEMLVTHDGFFKAHELVRDAMLPAAEKVQLYEALVLNFLLSDKSIERSLLHANIAAIAEYYDHTDNRWLQFLSKLAALDQQAHAYALSYVKK